MCVLDRTLPGQAAGGCSCDGWQPVLGGQTVWQWRYMSTQECGGGRPHILAYAYSGSSLDVPPYRTCLCNVLNDKCIICPYRIRWSSLHILCIRSPLDLTACGEFSLDLTACGGSSLDLIACGGSSLDLTACGGSSLHFSPSMTQWAIRAYLHI